MISVSELKFFKHQQDVLKQIKNKNRVGLFLDMGLGKTFVGAEKLHQLNKSLNILICQKSLIPMWIKHFETYYPEYQIHNGREEIPTKFDTGKHLLIINYDLVFRRDLEQFEDYTLLLDESSQIQNPKTKRTKAILNLKPENIILLSGTPVSGKYENLWSQAHLLGWKISESLFLRQYVNWETIEVGGFFQKIVDKENPYRNEERMKKKLRQNGAVFMKTDEVFDLPEQVFTIREVTKNKQYKEFERHRYVDLGDVEIIGDTTLTARLGLRQLAGIYSKEKLESFKDLIESTNERLIVFYNFNKELDELIKLVGERPYGIVNGSEKNLEPYETESDSITFIQYQAGSHGLNLQKANHIIYYTLPENSELFEQSKKRTHRIGQEKTCFYHILMVENSIEEKIYETLQKRQDYTDELFKEEFE